MQTFSIENAPTLNETLSKLQILKINQTKWISIFTIIIVLIESVLFLFFSYSTLLINAIVVVIQSVALYYTISTMSSKLLMSEEYNKMLGNKFLLKIIIIALVIDLLITCGLNYISFISNDEYERYFACVYVLISIMKIGTIYYNHYLIDEIEKIN